MIRKYSLILVVLLFTIKSYAVVSAGKAEVTDDPTMIIHDSIVGPGEMLLQIDALHFTGDNGMISAITLKIDIDTNLIKFIGIQNTTLFGSWLANYNYQSNEISIIYTAFSGMGYDIDGKLLDLHFVYNGGFSAPLHFKDGCEVSNVNLQSIDVIYEDGLLTQTSPVGAVRQDTVLAHSNNLFSMPVIAGGAGYNMVNQFYFRVEYDSNQVEFSGITESLLTEVESNDTNQIVTIAWEDDANPIDLTTEDTLFFINYIFIGDTATYTSFLPGSKVYNDSLLAPSIFFDGLVNVDFLVEIIEDPDTAGITSGEGYYFEDDTVTVSAEPNDGFHFDNWELNGVVVSVNPEYSFVKEAVNDTLYANFEPNSYVLSLFAIPPEGGTVAGAGTFPYGSNVTVTATPADGYDFVAWLFGDDTVSLDPVYSFVMPNYNMSLTAQFQIQTFSITAVPNNINYGTTSGGGVYNFGDTAVVSAFPFEDYKFVVWTENGQPVSYDPVYSFFVNADRELFANFQYDAVCSAPVGLYVDSLSDSTAMLHWLPSGEESEWDMIWGVYGFDTIDEGELHEGLTELQYFLTNLEQGTIYDYYVRAVCTDEEHSTWAGPYTFTTWYVGIGEGNKASQIVIYPNPALNRIIVNYKAIDAVETVSYKVINLSGIVELSDIITVEGQFEIDLQNLSSGIYFLQLSTDGYNISQTFIKQ